MNLANKEYKNNITGEVVKVIDSFDRIAILENKQKLDTRDLLNPSLYTEITKTGSPNSDQIDVKNFFNTQSAYDSLAQKIKNIPTNHMIDENQPETIRVNVGDDNFLPSANESAVIMSDPEQEKLELARKYGASMDNMSQVQRQNETFAKILGEDEDLPKTKVVVNNQPQQEVKREYIQPAQRIEVMDPIQQMFKNVKRNVNFKMNIEISNKIPRLDFIEMMEDSYEVSIIDFLAEEFTQNLLNDPNQIKEMIKDKIKKIVYGAEVSKEETKAEEKIKEPKTTKKAAPKKSRTSTKKEASEK